MTRNLIGLDSVTALNRPTMNGENDELRNLCELILDNWRAFTPKQVGIASTLTTYARPAEMITSRQKFNMDTALKLAKETGLIGSVIASK